jgi:hypothetical protein
METTITKLVETDVSVLLHVVRDKDGHNVPVSDFWADNDNDLIVDLDARMVTTDVLKMLEYLELHNVCNYAELVKYMEIK